MNAFEANAAKIESTSDYLAAFMRADRQFLKAEDFTYNVDILGVATATAVTQFVQMQADSDFVLQYITANLQQVDGTLTTLQITDTSTGRTFYSQAGPLALLVGGWSIPLFMPAPRLIAPNVNLKFELTNNQGQTLDYRLALLGTRVFYGGPN